MYAKITAGQVEIFPYSVANLRRDNPNTSFPKLLSDELLVEWGMYPYTAQARPDYDRLTQTVTQTAITEVNGAWTQGWTVSDMAAEDAAQNIRNKRDNLLSQTDWMALSDVSMEPYWAEYRQQLRDITAQEGFPFNVVWPTKP